MWSGLSMAVLMVVIQLVLPCYLAYDIWRTRNETRWAWCLRAAGAAAYVGLIFLTGRWDLLGYYLRFLVLGVFTIAAVAGYMSVRTSPWVVDGRPGEVVPLISSVVF